MNGFRRLYGASSAHLLLLAASFVGAGYLVDRVVHASQPLWIGIWLAGAIVAHDLVLFPLYALADRVLVWLGGRGGRSPSVPWINHVRVPAVLSGVLLLVTFPLVFRLGDRSYVAATGLRPSVYMMRWVVISASIFLGSGIVYLGRRVRSSGWTLRHRGEAA